MMYDDPQSTYGFSFCNYYYTYFMNYFAAPYQKLYRAHPISSYSMLLCMLYHLLLKYVNQILFVFSLFLAYYIIDNYYMSVGFKVKYVSREMSTVDLNNNNWVLYLIFLGLLLSLFCNTNSILRYKGASKVVSVKRNHSQTNVHIVIVRYEIARIKKAERQNRSAMIATWFFTHLNTQHLCKGIKLLLLKMNVGIIY